MAVAPRDTLARATAQLLSAWKRFCSAVSTVVKSVAPVSYCSVPTFNAPRAATVLRRRKSAGRATAKKSKSHYLLLAAP